MLGPVKTDPVIDHELRQTDAIARMWGDTFGAARKVAEDFERKGNSAEGNFDRLQGCWRGLRPEVNHALERSGNASAPGMG